MDITKYIKTLCQKAKDSSRLLARIDTDTKNRALIAITNEIRASAKTLKKENACELELGKKKGLNESLLDRLELTDDRIESMAKSLEQVANLPDPVGDISNMCYRPSGIQVGKMRVPLGVIGVIYESRPNVTADAAGLCLKSGNSVILRGGSEAIKSNQAIVQCIHRGLLQVKLPLAIVQFIETTDRSAVGQLIRMDNYIDVIIPRGGRGLIEQISNNTQVPLIKHLDGICHIYIEESANLKMAEEIAFNAKCHRYGVCNAMETLLIDHSIAHKILPILGKRYADAAVELRGCEQTQKLLIDINKATREDWDTEYLAPILSIRVVDGIETAMEHIHQHSSGHTETIVTKDYAQARRFMEEVDSSSVIVNASTLFSDGFEYGLGAEIGISTNKLHVRGPVGLEGLTSQKWIVLGNGQVRI